MRRHFDPNVVGANLLHPVMHDIAGQFRAVTFAAEMAEIHVTEVGRHDLFSRIGGRVVGQVAVTPQDSLLETPGPVGTVLKHFDIVVGLQNEHVGGPDSFKNQAVGMAQIGQKTDVAGNRAQQETDRILRVVRDGKGFDHDVANFKSRAGGEKPAGQADFELIFDSLLRGAVAKNGDLQLGTQRGETLNVIGVLVGDEDAIQFFGRTPDGGEALANLAQAEAGVNQEAGLVGLEVGAVPRRTTAQNRQANRHGFTLNTQNCRGNVFA